jgi:hypothetical protein
MRDYGTDMATVGRKLLSKKLRCSEDSLDRAKAELEKIGAITVERRANGNQIPRNVYTIHRTHPDSRTDAAMPIAAQERLPDSRTGAAMYESTSLDEKSSSSSKGGKSPQQVAGKKVTVREHDLTDEILKAFNERSGKNFAGAEWRRAIIGRIREHPEVTLDRHREIIEQQFAAPWWKGDATPAVIYGNGKVFDRALNSIQAVPKTRKYTAESEAE